MQRLGFIHDMLDVKVLILFVMSRVDKYLHCIKIDIAMAKITNLELF